MNGVFSPSLLGTGAQPQKGLRGSAVCGLSEEKIKLPSFRPLNSFTGDGDSGGEMGPPPPVGKMPPTKVPFRLRKKVRICQAVRNAKNGSGLSSFFWRIPPHRGTFSWHSFQSSANFQHFQTDRNINPRNLDAYSTAIFAKTFP